MNAPSPTLRDRTKSLYSRYEKYFPAGFFIAGFLFDIVTLGRIDDLFTMLSQAVYLAIIAVYLRLEMLESAKPLKVPRWISWLWKYRDEIVHFLFGSLLSAYTLFYLKSSSLVSSGIFLLLMVVLMLANEFSRFQQSGVLMRTGLLTLSLISYFGYVVPVLIGFTGVLPFLLAVGLSTLLMLGFEKSVRGRVAGAELMVSPDSVGSPDSATSRSSAATTETASVSPPVSRLVSPQTSPTTLAQPKSEAQASAGRLQTWLTARKRSWRERLDRWRGRPLDERARHVALSVAAVFLLLYVLQLVPPVPLSAQYMGIYHKVERMDGKYVASFHRPWWKIWQNGAQTFLARPGDRVYVFARVFSPARFADEIRVRWLYKDERLGWRSSDAIPIQISGGRDEGFRGFAYKQNWTPGAWRVQLETTDGREIGRISFRVEPEDADDTTAEREMKSDTF